MKEKQILLIVKNPGEEPVIEPLFDNTLEAFQKAVGGYIEVVNITSEVAIVCNEEGRLLGLPYNCTILNADFVGPIMVVGTKRDEFCSLRGSIAAKVLKALRQ